LGDAGQIENRGRHIYQTDDLANPLLATHHARGRYNKRNMHVLFV
jgi:hypothetical protein